MSAPYELVEHTADLAVRVRGRDLADLCRNLTFTVCDLLARADLVTGRDAALRILVDAPDREALLVALANELIFQWDAHGLLLPELAVERVGDTSLVATARGEPAAPAHEPRAGLKAATYHELSVTDTPDGVELFLVFDV